MTAFRNAGGILRTAEVLAQGIHPRTLYSLRDEGVIERIARGVYRLADHPVSRHVSLAVVASKYPQAVICLISALDWHNLTLQIPHEVQVALPPGAEEPRLRYPEVRAFRMSGEALTAGVETHVVDGVRVRIFGPEKTVADCFKFRNKIGVDIAMEALRACRERRSCDADMLWQYAKVCRVSKVMQPYLEVVG
jgi:predicted transcriptional regulator of viral defense system